MVCHFEAFDQDMKLTQTLLINNDSLKEIVQATLLIINDSLKEIVQPTRLIINDSLIEIVQPLTGKNC